MSESVMEGYQEYVKFHPEADYSNLARDFMDYLMTDEAQKILKDNLQEIIESTGGFKITIDQMQELVQRVMEGYQKYAAGKGYTDPDKFGEYLAEYLQTEEAKEIMNAWRQEIFGDTVINITSDQLKKLTKELASSYPAYAAANGKADPTKMGDYFLNYLATADWKTASDERAFRGDRYGSAGEPVKCDNGKLHGKGNGNLYRSNFGYA